MKLIEKKIVVRKRGYVKDEGETEKLCDEAEEIVEGYLRRMLSDLDQAGFEVEVL